MDYGTNVVAGVTPGKGGQMFDGKGACLRYSLGSATADALQRFDGFCACLRRRLIQF
jgi:succinyl-CoA synthetase alpha subunit